MDALYLSHLRLALRNCAVQADLSDCYAMHRRLMLAFPNLGGISDARNQFGVLYRVESTSGGLNLLIQSAAQPDWSRLPDGYLRDSITTIKRIDGLYASIAQGRRLLFRLRANPTRRISDRDTTQDERWRGKRVELRREADQFKWLVDKGKRSGFMLLPVRALPGSDPIADVRATGTGDRVIGQNGSHRLMFASVTFEGRLHVTDPAPFQQALWYGIGTGKAFGFGLLSIAPDSA
jgi:CRISPR system Cascade subunit CasE